MRGAFRTFAVGAVALALTAGEARAQDVGASVTSEATDASIDEPGFSTGLAAADAICNRLGAAIPGSGPWVAWLSDDRSDARDRIPEPGANGAYVLATEASTVIATDLADLTDGILDSPIVRDETGAFVNDNVWTGTSVDGTAAPYTCAGWSSVSPTLMGRWGTSSDADNVWTHGGDMPCDSGIPPDPVSTPRFYCFGRLAPTTPVAPLPALAALLALLLAAAAMRLHRRSAS